MNRYVPGEADLAALSVLRAELTSEARAALAHLLNNALTPALTLAELAAESGEILDALLHLRDAVRTVLDHPAGDAGGGGKR